MTNTYDTSQFPLGSTAPKVLYNNASNLDEAANGQYVTWVDRFGVIRLTLFGMEKQMRDAVIELGYQYIGDYDADGPLTVSLPNQIFSKDGEFWKAAAPPPGPGPNLPYVTVNNWATDQPKFVSVGDAVLRSDLALDTGAELIGVPNGTAATKFAESISAADKGATSAASNNNTALNAAIVAAGVRGLVYLGDNYKITPPLVNTNGVTFYGPGALLTAAQVPADGFRQVNTYADNNPVGIGREYLHRCYQYLNLGQSSPSGTLPIFLYGDSTVAGGNGETARFNPKAYLQTALLNKGVANVTVTNRAVSGSQISASIAQAVTDLASAPGLYILKSFINEGTQTLATRLADTETQLENWLAAVRGGGVNGDLGHLAIIVMGPNSTNNTRYQRDAFWYEQLRGMIIAKCRKYSAAYFDTYQMLQDTLLASSIGYMDQPYVDRPLDSVHPLDAMNAQIWGGMLDWALPDNSLYNYRSNNFGNNGAVSFTFSNATPPSDYPLGVQIYRTPLSTGVPVDGFVRVTKNVDSGVLMELFPFAAGDSRVLTRTADVSGNSWNPWTGQIHLPGEITFLNGWQDYNDGAVVTSAGFMLTSDGFVELFGSIKSGTAADGTDVLRIPAGFRTFNPENAVTSSSAASGVAVWAILTDGTVRGVKGLSSSSTSLNGIRYRRGN